MIGQKIGSDTKVVPTPKQKLNVTYAFAECSKPKTPSTYQPRECYLEDKSHTVRLFAFFPFLLTQPVTHHYTGLQGFVLLGKDKMRGAG